MTPDEALTAIAAGTAREVQTVVCGCPAGRKLAACFVVGDQPWLWVAPVWSHGVRYGARAYRLGSDTTGVLDVAKCPRCGRGCALHAVSGRVEPIQLGAPTFARVAEDAPPAVP